MRTNVFAILSFLLMGLSAPATAQLAPVNASGLTMGHLHLAAKDVAGMNTFFISLGGKPHALRPDLILFPGVAVVAREAKDGTSGGSDGSSVNHIGFTVKNFKEAKSKWDAAGVQWEKGAKADRGFLVGPEGIRVEITEDKSQATPIKFDHIHFAIPARTEEAAKWYAQTFGAAVTKKGDTAVIDLPGGKLVFSKSSAPVAGTKGRSLDHIGFDLNNLEGYTATLAARGIKFDTPYRKLPNPVTTSAVAFVTDPWGTYVELTQDLEGKK